MAPVRLEGGYRRGLERITELEDKRPDIDETLEGLRAARGRRQRATRSWRREEAKRAPLEARQLACSLSWPIALWRHCLLTAELAMRCARMRGTRAS
jgi:hypothetical protein